MRLQQRTRERDTSVTSGLLLDLHTQGVCWSTAGRKGSYSVCAFEEVGMERWAMYVSSQDKGRRGRGRKRERLVQ